MKIIISGRANALALNSDERITDPKLLRKLDGLPYSKDLCSRYLGRSLDDIGIRGGAIRLKFDADKKQLRVVTEFQSPRRLKPGELKKLVEETVGQWSDGIGEGEFLHRKKVRMDVDLYPMDGKGKAIATQIDDGKKIKAPRGVPLAKALRDGKLAEAKRLLAEGAEVNCKDKQGDTPLHIACLESYLELAMLLLEHGADATATNKEKMSPLVSLCMAHLSKAKTLASVPLAKALLDRGASVNAVDKEGMTPLMWAVNRGKLPLVECLIGAGADVNAKDRVKYNENTVLMYAQQVDVTEYLLRHGADPSICNDFGENAHECALREKRRLAAVIGSYMKGVK